MITSKGNVVLQLLGGRSNVFLVRMASGGNVLVDTSIKLARRMLMEGLRIHGAERPEYLVLTHNHFDHAANAAFIRQSTGARVVIHQEEAAELRSGIMKIPEGTYPFTKRLVNLAGRLNLKLAVEPCEVDIEVIDYYRLPGLEGIELIHTPGHSKGSMSVIVDKEIAIVGDAMINAILFKVFPPFADDTQLLRQSWQKLLATGCHTFLPSHGKPLRRLELEDFLRLKAPSEG